MPKYTYAHSHGGMTDLHTETVSLPYSAEVPATIECSVCGQPLPRDYRPTPVHFRGDGFTTPKPYMPVRGDLK